MSGIGRAALMVALVIVVIILVANCNLSQAVA